MINPLEAMVGITIVVLGISIWGMVTEKDDEETEDHSGSATEIRGSIKEKPRPQPAITRKTGTDGR
jgi:hypothetical protein